MTDILVNKLQNIKNDKDANLLPENLKEGVTCLGVEGIMNEGVDTSDANATANDILMNKTAYINGEKITGTLPLFPNSRTFVVDNAGVTDNTEDSTLELTTINTLKQTIDSNLNMKFSAPYSDIVTAIGLTTDKLVQGNTILGVEGNAESTDITDYIDVTFDKTSTSSSQNGVASLVKKLDAVNMNNVTLLGYFFSGCSNLESIGEIQNMGNATNISYMFSDCTNLIQIPNLDTSNATDMSGMFYKCSSLTTIPTLNTSNVKQIATMFQGCTSLTSLPITNLGNATNISGICRDCSSLTEIPQFDTSKVTGFQNAFLGCSSITSLPLFNTSSVTNMGSAFSSCSNLTEIPQFDTSNVTNMSNMFNGDTNLVTIPILNTSKATCNNMIENCPNLSDESLNNVLYMLANSATSSSYKTLKRAGFSNEQANKAITLSNWSACETAGWTTGY